MSKRKNFLLPPTKILLLPQESQSKEAEGVHKGSQPLISYLMFYPLLIKKILGKFKYPKKVLILDMYKEKSWDLSVIKPKSVKIAFGEIERQASLLEAKRKGLATLTTAQFVALIKDLE